MVQASDGIHVSGTLAKQKHCFEFWFFPLLFQFRIFHNTTADAHGRSYTLAPKRLQLNFDQQDNVCQKGCGVQ
jgi:hypothetical protein